jgi:signal transduction histidine kinase
MDPSSTPESALQHLLEGVDDRGEALQVLSAFAISLLRLNTLEEVLWDIVENAGRLLGFEDCVLYLREPQGLVQCAAYGVKDAGRHEILTPIVVAVGDGIVGTVAASGEISYVRDVSAHPKYIPDQFSGRSELAVPIRYEGTVVGVLDSECSRVDGFSDTDQALFAAVAAIAAPRIVAGLAHRERRLAERALADAEERNRQSEERHRAQRIESLGVLAGGIAHDFNNLLTAIMGNLSLVRSRCDDGESDEMLDEAERACERARSLTKQLLTFSSGGMPVRKTGDMGELLLDSVNFALRGAGVTAEFEVAANLPRVSMDSGQIAQVFHNLILNAVQAMSDTGEIRISARTDPCAVPMGIEIRIHDSGPGIPTSIRGRVFEPYFTTKRSGSGLGLATSFSIIRSHGGVLELDSLVENGACFVIRIPAAPAPGAESDLEVPRHEICARVLVLDDEPAVGAVICRMLETLGHTVDLVEDGAACIASYIDARNKTRPFDLVIMDLTIPGKMGGREAIRRLLALDAHVQAIAASGYSEDPVLAHPQRFGFVGRLQKPFQLRELDEQIRRVLGS